MKSIQLIQVTEDDVARATRNDSHTCAVATAIARTLPEARRIMVDMQFIRFTEGVERWVYATPPAVQSYIIDFDAGDEVGPFAFKLTSRNRARLQQSRRTPAGRQVDAARAKATYQADRAKKVAADPDASPRQRRRAKENAQAATKEYERVYAEVKGQPQTAIDVPSSPPTDDMAGDMVVTRAPSITGRKRSRGVASAREYGLRTMRINQVRDAK
jgi:hypothetical protein